LENTPNGSPQPENYPQPGQSSIPNYPPQQSEIYPQGQLSIPNYAPPSQPYPPYQQQPYIQMPQPQVMVVAATPTNGLAVTSMILGILSILGIWVFFLGMIPALLGIILGHVALQQIKKSNNTQGGNGMAIAGLVLNYLVFAPGILCLGAILVAGASAIPFLSQ
jgi:hypothetical protein